MPVDRFLVDTSAWIFALRRDPIPSIRERIGHLLHENAVLITGIIQLEILGGARTDREFHRLKGLLDVLDRVEAEGPVWERAYGLAFTLKRKGITVPYTDILIAACAMVSGSTLIHADAHFDLMAQHVDLEVESLLAEVRNRGRP